MAKRGYKLQEFVAHAGNVNCLSFGRKNCRVFITGGDDQKVNLWSVGKPTSLMSLCGHTSPVESAAFDSAEVLVAAGSSSGAIKLWDLEETKLVRTLTGHRSYCTAVEFHPFGELFASGSMDTNLKIWDIRKKGCIQTYKGHTRGISTIRFSPDGRWVVSGGFDNVVKVWDLTAGKLLHDFKFHEGHIRSIEFHPLEFLLATGSADKTVKFWDLETFEMIGSARRESSGVRSITFHPDGRSLFCGSDDSLKVYSWEPVICHDSVDMGWSTLGDLCVHDGKLLGGAYYENSVAIWVADISLIERNGSRSAPEQLVQPEQKSGSRGSLLKKDEIQDKSKSNMRPATPESDCKEIKTIYVDPAGVNSISSKAVSPVDAPKIVLRRVNSITSRTADPTDAPNVVLSSNSKEISTSKTQVDASKPVLRRLNSLTSMTVEQIDSPKVVLQSESKEISTPKAIDSVDAPKLVLKPVNSITSKTGDSIDASNAGLSSDSKEISSSKTVDLVDASKAALKRVSSVKRGDSVDVTKVVHQSGSKEISTPGTQKRTPAKRNVSAGNRSLVMPSIVPRDGPSRRNSLAPAAKTSVSASAKNQTRRLSDNRFDMGRMSVSLDSVSSESSKSSLTSRKDLDTRSRLVDDEPTIKFVVEKQDRMSSPETPSNTENGDQTLNSSKSAKPVRVVNGVAVVHGRTRSLVERFEKRESSDGSENDTPVQASNATADSRTTLDPLASRPTVEPLASCVASEPVASQETVEPVASRVTSRRLASSANIEPFASCVASGPMASRTTAGSLASRMTSGHETSRVTSGPMASRLASIRLSSSVNIEPFTSCVVSGPLASRTTARSLASQETAEPVASRVSSWPSAARVTVGNVSSRLNADPENITMNKPTTSDDNFIENVMENHELLLSTFRSRLTKLQVVRHFWERNDVKGAINAVKKLPDRSVQADVVDVITGRMEIVTLDLFSCLLPVLVGLLENKVERHATVSLEMLLKFVAVFGSTVRSTVSAPPAVGVDLHLEERRECSRQCFTHLQHVQKFLPELVKRGGVVARSAQQLNLVLQQVL